MTFTGRPLDGRDRLSFRGHLSTPRCAGFTEKPEDRDKPLSACSLTGLREDGCRGLSKLGASSCFSWVPFHRLPCRSKAVQREEPEPGEGARGEVGGRCYCIESRCMGPGRQPALQGTSPGRDISQSCCVHRVVVIYVVYGLCAYACTLVHIWRPDVADSCLPRFLSSLFVETGSYSLTRKPMVRLGWLSHDLPLPPQCRITGTSPQCLLTQVPAPKPRT